MGGHLMANGLATEDLLFVLYSSVWRRMPVAEVMSTERSFRANIVELRMVTNGVRIRITVVGAV